MKVRTQFWSCIGLILSILLLVGCATTKINSDDLSSLYKDSKESQYVIGPEDILRIYVWKQPQLSMTVPVRSDGKISLPLINDVLASGLTPHQLKDRIANNLSKFIENPTVSVIVEVINSMKIIVTGNVNAPGIYKIGNEIRLLDAITLANGFTDYADTKRIRLVRGKGSSKKIYEINYDSIINLEDIRQNIILRSGDILIIP